MTPAEYDGWRRHIVRYPPLEHILTAIWLMLANTGANEGEAVDHTLMGYWLESPDQLKERLEAEREAQVKAAAQRTKEMYLARREQEGAE